MTQMGLFPPQTTWVRPASLPVIPTGVDLGIDTETRDDGLARGRGPGWATGEGYLVGISVAWGQHRYYIPVRHPDTENFSIDDVREWLQDAMGRARRVIFHNAGYDAAWLAEDGIRVDFDRVDDTQFMAVMLDENQRAYNLDVCCARAGVVGKDERLLATAALSLGLDPKSELWKMPAAYVGPYAEQDAGATLELWRRLRPQITAERLEAAYRLEIDLIPVMIAMRRRGIRIDESAVDRSQAEFRRQRDEVLADLGRRIGDRRPLSFEEANSPKSLMRLFEEAGVEYPTTPKTKIGSFSSEWMEQHEHWLPQGIARARQLHALAEKFLGTYIMGSVHLGRIHSEIHQLRDDSGGTRTYRLSYSDPPLQQIPTRTVEGAIIREVFLPERGTLWMSADYSQQEPRLAVHYASVCKIPGASDAVSYYLSDPRADFHDMVAEITGLKRKQAKIINLGLMYGMGIDKLARDLGVSREEAVAIIAQYHDRMPFVKGLAEFCSGRASTRGHIMLLDGARCRFPFWEPVGVRGCPPLTHEAALAKSKRVRRWGTHKAMNRLIQGSAARQTKMAMLLCHREGHTPLIQMHDELGVPITRPGDAERVCEIMRDAAPLRVPMRVDAQFGHSWGQASEDLPKKMVPPTFEEILSASPSDRAADIAARRAA